mmetsp:Transcript_44806/g.136796  ORF Transcript_44806/g.136796 Transcript_44806/m.136796 type:complete len:320 (-) Transcript_44806:102-1061(-)
MRAGVEVHFLAGQIFTLGIAAVAILPRIPSDPPGTLCVGGRLSHPFRRALIGLIAIGFVRVVGFHLYHPDSTFLRAVDAFLGTVHVAGQSFLCLTTAYILQCQLSSVVNIEGGAPGRSLVPALAIVLVLTGAGAILSATWHPNAWCLVNLAEAYSCLPVLKTLRLYANATTLRNGRQQGKGSVMVQILTVIERWYLVTSLVSFVGEAIMANDNFGDADVDESMASPLVLILRAVCHNQDNGVDDWTRLVLHSVVLNSIDELQHFTPPSGDAPPASSAGDANRSAESTSSSNVVEEEDTFSGEHGPLLALRRREKHHELP